MSNYKIVISSTSDYYKSIEYCFGENNIITINENEDIKKLENIANKLSEFNNIIFFNLTEENNLILNMLSNKIKKYLIFEPSISELAETEKLNSLFLIVKYLDINLLNDVYCINKTTYQLFEEKYNFKYIQLDIKQEEKISTGTSIGLISEPDDFYSSIMNELSAITLTDFNEIRVMKPLKPIKSFAKRFGIKVIKEKDQSATIMNNEINMYINFSKTNYTLILESMDQSIPCIVGNTDFFDENKILKEYLVVKSDDSINEMRDKLINVKENKKLILKEYDKFRKEYTKKSQKSLLEFKSKLK